MDDDTLSDDSNLLSGTSSEVFAPSDANLSMAMESLEMEKRQTNIKIEQHRGKTLVQATKLRKLIDQHRGILDKLSSEYSRLGDQSASLSQISRLKEIDEASSLLEKRLDEKRQLAQEKSRLLRQTQRLIELVQQRREERDRLHSDSSNMDDKIEQIRDRIAKMKSEVSSNRTRLDTIAQSSCDIDMQMLSAKETELKLTLEKDVQRMQDLRKSYQEMEETYKNNIKRQTKSIANNKQEKTRCENVRKKIGIIESDLTDVYDMLQQLNLHRSNNESIVSGLHDGIIHLRKFKDELEVANYKVKNQCKEMWSKYKSTLLELEEIEEEMLKNSQATHRLCNIYKHSVNS